MTDIAIERLYNQQIANPRIKTPGELVTWLGAIQAQEYHGGIWTLGLRLPGSVDADIERAVADKTIVRVFFMRGTLHFVPGADIRWMIPLISERVRRLLNSTAKYNKTGLDEAAFLKGKDIIARAMEGGRQLIRAEVKSALTEAGINTNNMGYMFLIQRAAVDGLVCYGQHRGKQQTFTLIKDWVPQAKILAHDEALAEFARRFFVSHGPATVHDFAHWSGLPVANAKAGLAANRGKLVEEIIDGSAYYFAPPTERPPLPSPDAHLLPTYDEYLIGYKDRSASVTADYGARWFGRTDHFVSPLIIDGRMVGVWWRELKKGAIVFHIEPFEPLSDAENESISQAARRYADFLGLEAVFA